MQTTCIPDISVNIAVFNTKKYLQEAINSVLTQSFQNFELIIVDDGSTDGSWDILVEYARRDSRIKLFQQANSGVAAARNLALKNSWGQYIAVMDSDDISLPGRFALQKDFLDAHPDINAVGSQWLMIKPNGEEVGIDTHATDPSLINGLMYDYYSLHHPTTMIRRESMEAVGGYNEEKGRLCVDYDLFMRMQVDGCKFSNLPFVLFKWRLNPDGITQSKARRQTEFVIQTRDQGFAQLLQDNPEQSHAIAKTIVYNFPTGTWQDHKIRQLFSEQEESLLYRTWEALPPDSEEQFNRALVLWLRKPQVHFQTLHDQLKKNEMPWLASLVAAYHGLEKALPTSCLNLPERIKNDAPLISLFVPFLTCADDFNQRLEQAIALHMNSNFSIELVVFSSTPDSLDQSLISTYSEQVNMIIIQDPSAWEKALCSAQGLYFMYLEENFRFNTNRFLAILAQVINDKTDILYMIDKRHFTEAVDDAGNPLLDNSATPTWTRSTLFGKDRVNLTGFVHTRSLLNGFNGDLKECGIAAGRVLARHLATRNSFAIVTEAVSYLIPITHLDGRPLPVFQKTILDWYYDYGTTALPASTFWSALPKPTVRHYARCLSDAWLNNDLVIHPGNSNTIKQFYLGYVVFSMRWPFFRHFLLHNKKSILTVLWNNRNLIDTFAACLYCGFIIFRNRCAALFNL